MDEQKKWAAESLARSVQRASEAKQDADQLYRDMLSIVRSLDGTLVEIEAESPEDWSHTNWGPYDTFDFSHCRDGVTTRVGYIQGIMDHFGKPLIKVERFPNGYRFSWGIDADKIKGVKLAEEDPEPSA